MTTTPNTTVSRPGRKSKAKTAEQLAVDELRKTNPVAWRANKLRELAARRVPNAIKRIKQCGNLAAYKPTDEQSVAICDALQVAINVVRMRLKGQREGQTTFDLPT